jgi:cell division protein FtsB
MEVQLQQKKLWRRYLYSKASLLVLLVLIIVVSKAVLIAGLRQLEVSDTASRVSSEEKSLLDRKVFLTSEIAKLSTKEGRESELRNKYGVAKSGEQMAVIVEPGSQINAVASSTDQGLWGKFLGLFKSK